MVQSNENENIIIVENESEINFNDIIIIKEHVEGKLENIPSLQIKNNKKFKNGEKMKSISRNYMLKGKNEDGII
jgi:hypothetical protein